MDWSVNTIQFLALKEVHDIFKAGAENIVVSPHRKTAPNLLEKQKTLQNLTENRQDIHHSTAPDTLHSLVTLSKASFDLIIA